MWRSSATYRVFNAKDERGFGRLCMLLVSLTGGVANQISGGFFYTGFLTGYGLDMVDIGILTFIPSICCVLNIFSPLILERIKKRRWILAASRLAYYTITIVGITLLPVLIKDRTGQMWGFIAILILSNSINTLFGSGYTAWQANFLPDNIRADYSIVSGGISSCFSGVVVLVVSVITDKLADSPAQLDIIILFRYIAYALAVLDVILISLPKEYPYPKTTEKTVISDMFTMPLRNRRFALTMLIACAYNFISNLPNATLNTYLLQDVHVSYTFMNSINASFFLFYIVFGNLCRKFIAKNTWFKSFAYVLLVQSLTYFAYVFVTAENYGWLLLSVRLSQHVLGVATNTIVGMMLYVNLPDTDRMNYISFYAIASSATSFLSMMLGTVFVGRMGETVFTLFGKAIKSTPVLLLSDAVGQALLAVFIFIVLRKVTPPEGIAILDAAKKRAENKKAMKKSV